MKCIITLLLGFSVGCGSVDRFGGARQQDPLSIPRQTRGLVDVQTRFAALVPSAGRVTVIDPASERETAAFTAPAGATNAFPVGRVDGVAAVGPGFLEIRSDGAARRFDTNGTGAWDAAETVAALAFAAPSGLRAIRSLTGGGWQDETIAVSGADAATQPLVAADGARAVLLAPSTGWVAVFEAASEALPWVLVRTCAAGSVGADLVAAFLDGGILVTGDKIGTVRDTDLASCTTVGTPLVLAGVEVARIGRFDPETLAVTQVGGGLSMLSGGAGSRTVKASVATGCEFPTTPYRLSALGAALLCIESVQSSDTQKITFKAASVRVLGADLKTLRRILLPTGGVAGWGLSLPSARLYELRDAALGTLTVTDLATGANHQPTGLFANGILDEL